MTDKITEVEREFLKILKSYMHDNAYEFPEEFDDISKLFGMAQIHNVLAVVYEQVRTEKIWEKPEYQQLQGLMKKRSIFMVMGQMQKTMSFLNVYQRLGEAGVFPLVVKGVICRNLYSKPDHRISSDEDMLIKKEDFEVCDRVLLENGFQRGELDKENMPYEIPYCNQKTGVYIELHFSLFPKDSEAYGFLNQEFGNVFEQCIYEEIQGVHVWTLNPTDHMFYLMCHSFKHFLHSGFGIRQVCDMVMMAEHYGSKIEWELIGKKLNRLNMASFWAALATIGKEYLGFDWKKANYCSKLQRADVGCEDLLMDLLQSGVYGDSSKERKHSSNITLAAMKTGKKDTVGALQASLFPPMGYMKTRYEWLQDYPILLPVAWGMRMYSYFSHMDVAPNKQRSEIEIGMERVELLKKYRIIR